MKKKGKGYSAEDAADEIVFAHQLIGQEKQGDVEQDVGDADLPAEQVEQDHAQAGDAAAEQVMGQEEGVQGDTGDTGAQGNGQIPFQLFIH